MALTVLLFTFLALLLFGLPVAFCFATSSLAYFLLTETPLALAPKLMSTGVAGYTLLAVPLYILAGELLNLGGITERIFNFAKVLVGRIRGGLGHVNVLASLIFSGMSGSSSADAAGLGRIEIEAMIKNGYSREFAASITAVSSSIGPIVPPSIHLVLYGAIAEVGVDYLFLGGIVPGVIMTLCLMAAIYIIVAFGFEKCPRHDWAGLKALWRATRRAIFPLSAPLIIVGGILSGVFTPTEAGAVAVAYALLLALILGEMNIAVLFKAMKRAVRSTAVVMFILATAKLFAWGITIEQVPELLADALFSITADPKVLLLIVLAGLLLLGMFESASANLVIVTPILVPLAPALGLDLVHLGVVMVLALMIGIITPPVGMSLYIVSDIAQISFNRVAAKVFPYLVALIVALLIVAYMPAIVLTIPKLYGYAP